ncbi:hypothetical protein GPJ56_010922 [Histomonas meleagridis]|uniref:uncharacterized protein n=1 Tax=Histomonas meleagridis TaxID=135588 RepID=UPI00355969C8|nr:hypothetical protein GPJ56_010922 [Histomonas meleagridis]KAH0806277.1 hypothetical protein GO595_000965 [Histomonas meleagridis]
MKSTPIPIKRELVDFHRQAKEVGATTTLKNHELTNLRKKLLNKVKSLQEIRCLTSLRTGYFLKLSSSNVQSTSQLPFMKPNGFKIAERLVELSGISSYRSNITKLLKELYTQLDKLPEKLALLNFDNFPDNPPYLPAGVKAREFFVCSTVPALFGYNWAVELRESFLSFIFSIAEHIPSSTLQNFREHWLFDCIKNYIHSSGINQFLRISIGSTIYRLVRDQELQRLSKLPNDQQIFFDKLTEYASDMINHMHENIEIFPSDVRTIIRRFTTLSKDTETRLSRAETLFLDSILVPSISNPKAYGVLPSTFYLDISPFGPARCLQMLAQLFRFILHPNQIKLRYPKYDSAKIELLPFEPFLNDLISIDDNKEYVLTGPKLNDILPTLKAHFILLLFSLPDIFLLSDVLQLVLTNGTLLNVAKKLQTNQSVSFDFFRYEVWDFDVFRIKKPIIPDEEIEKLPKNKSSIVGDAIYKFMEFFDVDETSPNGYEQFFEYHEHNMILQHKYIHETYIRNLNMAYNDVPKDEKNTIIPSLEAD